MTNPNVARRITVTQDDIDQGCQSDNKNCPIARAALRAFPEAESLDVAGDIMLWLDRARLTASYWSMPTEARSFITQFDIGEEVEPFSFFATHKETLTNK